MLLVSFSELACTQAESTKPKGAPFTVNISVYAQPLYHKTRRACCSLTAGFNPPFSYPFASLITPFAREVGTTFGLLPNSNIPYSSPYTLLEQNGTQFAAIMASVGPVDKP